MLWREDSGQHIWKEFLSVTRKHNHNYSWTVLIGVQISRFLRIFLTYPQPSAYVYILNDVYYHFYHCLNSMPPVRLWDYEVNGILVSKLGSWLVLVISLKRRLSILLFYYNRIQILYCCISVQQKTGWRNTWYFFLKSTAPTQCYFGKKTTNIIINNYFNVNCNHFKNPWNIIIKVTANILAY